MVLFRKAKPAPETGREKPDAAMMPLLPELPEDDLMVPIKTWEASQGWAGPDAVEPALAAMRDARTKAVQTHQRIVADMMLCRRTAQSASSPCGYCGREVSRTDGKLSLGDPWRYCPTCWQMIYAEAEVHGRRLAIIRELLPDDLPPEVTTADLRGCSLRYFCELPDKSPTGEPVQPWSWITKSDRAALRDKLVSNAANRVALHRAPGDPTGRCCGGCGVLLSVKWSATEVPIMRAGHESDGKLPLCLSCSKLLIASGGDPRSSSWVDRLFWDALDLDPDRVEGGWAAGHHFMSYAERYADGDAGELHNFEIKYGWISPEDLAAVRDNLLIKVPERSRDPQVQRAYRRRERMRWLAQNQYTEPAPPAEFSVTPTATPASAMTIESHY